jgi:thymidylate kinase
MHSLLLCLTVSCLFSGQSSKGLFITAVGLPGSGKSSAIKELAGLIDGSCFCEPEEKHWADAATLKHLSGNFTMITWFRSMRVPQLYRASLLRSSGEIALTDRYYDKLLAYYIDKPGMEWLISPSDPYFDAMVAIAKKDWEQLPTADVIIFFEVSYDLWKDLLIKRNCLMDLDPQLLESFATQEIFFNACKKLADEKHVTLIKIQQEWSSPRATAEKIRDILYAKGIVQPHENI